MITVDFDMITVSVMKQLTIEWDKVFKSRLGKFRGRQSLKNLHPLNTAICHCCFTT